MATLGKDGKPTPPSEFRIFKKGMNESTKGVFKFTETSQESVMKKAASYGNDLAIDYAHGMFAWISADPAEAGKAAGWFKPEVRSGELWASSVSWTPKAAQMIADREYRYISPAFDHDQAGEILALLNVALTNIPALHELEPLVASRLGASTDDETEERDMNWKQLLAMLNLPETATEAEAMAAISRKMASTAMPPALLALTGKATESEAMAVVQAWKVAAESAATMAAELSQVKQAQLEAKKKAMIDEGKRKGCVPPAYEPVLLAMDMPALEAFLKVAVPVHQPAGKETQTVTHQTVALSQEDRSVAAMLGVSPEDFAKRKAARGGVVPLQLEGKPGDA